MGSSKRKNTILRRSLKKLPCDACGVMGTDFNPIDPCHIRTWKVTQSDHPANVISMCRRCHQWQHNNGWNALFNLRPHIKTLLMEKGWQITKHPFQDSVILTHPEIK